MDAADSKALWGKCDDPETLLAHALNTRSKRKRRLIVCACARRVVTMLADPRYLEGLEVAERFADGQASDESRNQAAAALEPLLLDLEENWQFLGHPHAANAVYWTLARSYSEMKRTFSCAAFARATAHCTREYTAANLPRKEQQLFFAENKAQSDLVRDVTGDPFEVVRFDAVWCQWRDGTVPKLAQAAYDERELPAGLLDPVRIRIVADALEEAGCTSGDILEHLREPLPHVRGCWVLDWLLGKK